MLRCRRMIPAKLVTFDVTGTLLIFRIPIIEKYCQTGLKYGIKTDPEVLGRNFKRAWTLLNSEHPNFGKASGLGWHNWWSRFVEKTFKGFVKSEEELKISQIAEDLIAFYRTGDAFTIRPGTENLLKYLKGKNVRMGVISNYDPRLHEILKLTDLRKYFDFVLTSYDFECTKPGRRIFQHALRLGGCASGEEAVHVGDDIETDYLGSKRCGMRAVLINSNPGQLKGVDECEVCEDLFALKTYFECLHKP